MTTALKFVSVWLVVAGPMLASAIGQSHNGSWPAKDYAKVVGYRFKVPSADSKGPVPSGFSLITKTGLDSTNLAKLTIKSAVLSPVQVTKLEKAAFSTSHRTEPAACYDPHHIFVLYAKDGSVTNAIEVCFSCSGVGTFPAVKEQQWSRHDFVGLAHLADELGLWLENRTVKAYEEIQKDRE